MEESRVKTLKALAKSFARVDKRGSHIKREPWSADFIKGKRRRADFSSAWEARGGQDMHGR